MGGYQTNTARKLLLVLLTIAMVATMTFVGVALPGTLIGPLTAVADGSGVFADSPQRPDTSSSEIILDMSMRRE